MTKKAGRPRKRAAQQTRPALPVIATTAPKPQLIVPSGPRPIRRAPDVDAPHGPSLAVTQIRELVASMGGVKADLPWARLSARYIYVPGKAHLMMTRPATVNGWGDVIYLTVGAAAQSAAELWVDVRIAPGQMFVVVFNGWCGGSGGLLHYAADNGSGDLAVAGAFSLPVVATDTDDDASISLSVKTATGSVTVSSIEIWKVD